jgi:hypothetical protein
MFVIVKCPFNVKNAVTGLDSCGMVEPEKNRISLCIVIVKYQAGMPDVV